MAETEYTLAALANAAGMSERNVRAYQSRGLLPPPRRRGRHVVYGYGHLARLRLVRALADHGLSLRVIGDLIERGTADDELARLAREELAATQTRGVAVSLAAETTVRFTEENPGVLEMLEEAGLVERHGDELLSNATALGLTSSVVARGGDFGTCARIGLAAARAAHGCREEIAQIVESCISTMDGGRPDGAVPDSTAEELRRLSVQLASTAFYDALTRHVLGEGLTAPRR